MNALPTGVARPAVDNPRSILRRPLLVQPQTGNSTYRAVRGTASRNSTRPGNRRTRWSSAAMLGSNVLPGVERTDTSRPWGCCTKPS